MDFELLPWHREGRKMDKYCSESERIKSWKYAPSLNHRAPLSLNYRVELSFRKWTLPPPCWRSQMSHFLPNKTFPWSRQVQKLRNLPWNGSVIIQFPLFEYDQLFKQRGGLGVWGSGPNRYHNEVLPATKKLNHISPPFTASRSRCCSEGYFWHFQLYILLFRSSISKQNYFSVLHLPCFLQAPLVLL